MAADVFFERARFLFWPVSPSVAKPTPAEARASGAIVLAGELPLNDRRTPSAGSEWSAVDAFLQDHGPSLLAAYRAQHLRRVLREAGAEKFIPHRPPSWDYDSAARAVEVCFYHNVEIHDRIYRSSPDYIMAPSGDLQVRLWGLYARHGADEYDESLFPEAEPGGDPGAETENA